MAITIYNGSIEILKLHRLKTVGWLLLVLVNSSNDGFNGHIEQFKKQPLSTKVK